MRCSSSSSKSSIPPRAECSPEQGDLALLIASSKFAISEGFPTTITTYRHQETPVALPNSVVPVTSRVILNPTADGTFELRTDVKIIRYPDRFTDSRGAELWETVLRLLAERREKTAMQETG
jgi:hypothetical protein